MDVDCLASLSCSLLRQTIETTDAVDARNHPTAITVGCAFFVWLAWETRTSTLTSAILVGLITVLFAIQTRVKVDDWTFELQ